MKPSRFNRRASVLEDRLLESWRRVASEDLQRIGRRVYRSVRPRVEPPERQIDLPSDVADATSLREYLRDTDIFGPAGTEADDYLADGFERFRITMALLPDLQPGARVLELGANPYFITRLLLRRGLDVTCANWFGEGGGFEAKSRQVVRGPRSGEEHVFEFDHFNVETSRFPYDDGQFDVVLCCEILEHLPNDPIHLFAEIHRVTAKPGGVMILTTPNAVRYDSLMRMQLGENIYEELSGYGTYGRHNREYTVAELQELLGSLGYDVHAAFARDVHPTAFPRRPFPPDVDPANRGDNLFVVAEPVGSPRWKYPRWLYSSQHAIRRIVRPDVVMGINDDLQTDGFHALETLAGHEVRWTGPSPASATLEIAGEGAVDIEVTGVSRPKALGGEATLELTVGDERATITVPDDGAFFQKRCTLRLDRGPATLQLVATPTFVPSKQGFGGDTRELGVAISSIRAVDAATS
jgi:SAM-dependent methyltransferase